MLDGQLVVHSVDLVYFALEFQPQGHLLIEGLFCLFVVFHQNLLIVFEVVIGLSQQFDLLENPDIFFLVDFLVIIDNFLPPLDLVPQRLHLGHLVPLDLPDHGLEISIRAVLEQDGVDLPECFLDVAAAHLFEEGVETHRVNEEGFEYAVQILGVYAFRQ